jgi:hypothetical protein
MGKYWRMLGEYDVETTTFTALAGGAGASPYTHDEDATLIGLRAIVGGDAATTLTELVEFRLTCTAWKPNQMDGIVVGGGGLRTAPFLQPAPVDYVVNQPVKASTKITIEARNITADTPVTNSVVLMGLFES